MKQLSIQTTLLLFLLITGCLACSSDKEKEPSLSLEKESPNIILLVGDDQGYPYFGFMGADYVQTPNMDSLAASGTLFTNGYVPDNHCRPALQSLMTGTLPVDYQQEVEAKLTVELADTTFASKEAQQKWSLDFRHHAMQHFMTLPKLLAQKGYNSFQGGKWWEYNYQNGGFTHGMTTGWTAEERKNGGKWFKRFMGGDGLQLARATMQPVYDFIEAHSEQPFFVWFAPELPHYPFDAPEKYYDIYQDQDMTESAKRYYANCTWFDDGVGALVSYLKEKGEFDNTLFVYVNDNGWEQNPDQEFRHDSLRWHNGGDKGKLSLYDQSYRTPIIFSWKNQIPAKVGRLDFMESIDIPATILDYVGIPIPEDFQGQSYKPVIEDKISHPKKVVIGNSNKMRSEADMMGKDIEGYWLRNQDWFFQWIASEETEALFNMTKDPENEVNLAAEHPELVAEFKEEIEQWKKEHH